MTQIDKMFPSNECSTCTILSRMLELTSNPNMTLLAFADVKSIEGEAGDFKVKVVKKPRYADPMKCAACTDCFPVCPVGGIPMEFNFGRGASKAIALMLEDFGLEEERFRLEWISASEGPKFVKVADAMTGTLKKLGPNPYKS